jgi:hypothetical protein
MVPLAIMGVILVDLVAMEVVAVIKLLYEIGQDRSL